jgi:hypothetical protein
MKWEIAYRAAWKFCCPGTSITDWKSDGTFHRFGQYSDALERIRADIAKGPIEKEGKLFGWLKLDQATRMHRLEREDDGFFVPKNS